MGKHKKNKFGEQRKVSKGLRKIPKDLCVAFNLDPRNEIIEFIINQNSMNIFLLDFVGIFYGGIF